VDVIISDDGLQHYALGRTLEIQLSDTRGHGNGWLLPAGPLREPASRRSDFYVINGAMQTGSDGYAMQLTGQHAEQLVDRRQHADLSSLKGKRVAAVAGIGHPERFFSMLRAEGLSLESTHALPDHFDFSSNPFAAITADIILITEKDAVKCSRIAGIAQDTRLWTVPVEATIAGPLAQHILEKLRG
jgi:tetraacyldisaccharide 4'-kinase